MRPYSLILAYHGCDRDLADKILLGRETVSISDNAYDWLGTGAYFWENDPERALQWANWIKAHPQHARHRIQKPSVIGAVINPGSCLDLTDSESLRLVKETYQAYKLVQEYSENKPLPENERGFSGDEDLVKRHLDCAVLNFLHDIRAGSSENEAISFDSVRGIFVEGTELYPGAKIMSRTHIQICVRDPKKSVVGYFLPRAF
jgi:hypothetical protein